MCGIILIGKNLYIAYRIGNECFFIPDLTRVRIMLNRAERSGKMKKKIISGIIISVIVLTIAYCLLWIFGSEAGINVFLSHNRGAINLFVNGENINIDGTEIEWYTYTDEIKNGSESYKKLEKA